MPPENKRKRTLSNSADSPADSAPGTDSFIKSTDIYLEDGNIAIVSGHIAFRVHRSQLAFHSVVFNDMLALVKEPQGGEVFDGCPVVRLTDDSQDLSVLFKVMYGRTHLKPEMVDQLIGVIRLSTKYLMDPIRTAAVEILAIAYPHKLDQWDAYHGLRMRCADVLKLATDVNADILLPAAYYAMSVQSTSTILSYDLPRPLLENCVRGKDVLMTKMANRLKTGILHRYENACDEPDCSESWIRLHTAATSLLMSAHSSTINGASDPLTRHTDLAAMADEHSLCWCCREDFLSETREERESIWRDLPGTFGLRSWIKL